MLYGLAIVLIPIFFGYLFKISNKKIMNGVNRTVNVCLYLILFVMGVSLGQLDDILEKLPQIGGQALALACIIMSCNVLALVVYDLVSPMPRNNITQGALSSRFRLLFDSFKLVGTTALGGLIGYWSKGIVDFPLHASTYVLEVMIFGVGIQLRNSGILLREVFFNRRGLYTSLVMMASSLAGGAFSALVLGLPTAQGLAFSAAFGWYSLSSVLVNDAWGAVFGSIAFFNDLAREIICLFIIPLFIQRFPSTGVGIGGATSLDCILPVIQKSGGTQIVPLAISFGFIVNLAAPLLLAFFIGLGSH